MMNIDNSPLIIPYSIPLSDIVKGGNILTSALLTSCIVLDDLQDDKILVVGLCWNVAIKFTEFYLPIVVRVYSQDYVLRLGNRNKDFTYILGAIRESYSNAFNQWNKEMNETILSGLKMITDEEILIAMTKGIVAKAEYYGIYD